MSAEKPSYQGPQSDAPPEKQHHPAEQWLGTPHGWAALLVVFFLGALALRIPHLSQASLWLDEVLQIRATGGTLWELWQRYPADKPPLDYFLQWPFLRLGLAEWQVRLHSCLAGSLAVVAFAVWGRVAGGAVLGLVLGLLAAANPFLIRFAIEGRPYSLFLLAEVCALAAVTRVAFHPDPPERRHWVGLLGAFIFCLWTHYLALLGAGLAVALAAAFRWRDLWQARQRAWLRPVLLAVAAFLLAAVPLAIKAPKGIEGVYFAPYVGRITEQTWLYLGIFACGYDWWQVVPTAAGFLIAALVLGAALPGGAPRRLRAFLALHFLGAFFGIFLFYISIDHWMEVRYTLQAFPTALMLAALAIVGIGRLVPGRWSLAVGGMLLAGVMGLQQAWVWSNPLLRPDYRGAADRIFQYASEHTTVITGLPMAAIPLEHYFEQAGRDVRVYSSGRDPEILREWRTLVGADLWTVDWGYDLPPEYREELKWIPEEYPPIQGLEVRRKMPLERMRARRPELQQAALSAEQPVLEMELDKAAEPFLGWGWSGEEHWGERTVRALDGAKAQFFFIAEEPAPLVLELDVVAYTPLLPVSVGLYLNDVYCDEQIIEETYVIVRMTMPEEAVQAGVNRLELEPRKWLKPADVEPGSGDMRDLSFTVQKWTLRRME